MRATTNVSSYKANTSLLQTGGVATPVLRGVGSWLDAHARTRLVPLLSFLFLVLNTLTDFLVWSANLDRRIPELTVRFDQHHPYWVFLQR